ncbi:hypothetical protein CSUI_005333 [Cystoisospora suis]|uniref:Uncharacterized protein n=1 Tax=Cystoisospora suis TaxID=483139 RepID=A0A2C6K6W2_9APIC|nr:hypothetical protein CSUI_005333 [Cystoisospora suis]
MNRQKGDSSNGNDGRDSCSPTCLVKSLLLLPSRPLLTSFLSFPLLLLLLLSS